MWHSEKKDGIKVKKILEKDISVCTYGFKHSSFCNFYDTDWEFNRMRLFLKILTYMVKWPLK